MNSFFLHSLHFQQALIVIFGLSVFFVLARTVTLSDNKMKKISLLAFSLTSKLRLLRSVHPVFFFPSKVPSNFSSCFGGSSCDNFY